MTFIVTRFIEVNEIIDKERNEQIAFEFLTTFGQINNNMLLHNYDLFNDDSRIAMQYTFEYKLLYIQVTIL